MGNISTIYLRFKKIAKNEDREGKNIHWSQTNEYNKQAKKIKSEKMMKAKWHRQLSENHLFHYSQAKRNMGNHLKNQFHFSSVPGQ